MTHCKNCGRKNTIHTLMGCLVCDPPDFTRLELVDIDVLGEPYLVPRGKKDELERFLRQEIGEHHIDVKTRIVIVTFDTGRCGPEAIGKEKVPLRNFLWRKFSAMGVNDNQFRRYYEDEIKNRRWAVARCQEQATF